MEKMMPIQSVKSITEDNNIAIAYIRVSTQDQKDKKFSYENQREKAIQYAKDNNLILDENMIFEEAASASKIYSKEYDVDESLKNRPVLQSIISLATQKRFNHFITYSRDRLTRNVEEHIALNAILIRSGISLHYSKKGENLSTEDKKISRFLEIVLSSLAEFESNTLSMRVKGGMSTCLKNGYWPGSRIPFGFVKEPVEIKVKDKIIKKTTIKSAHYEKNIVQQIFKYYNLNGYGYRKIANILNEEYETDIWTKSKVEAILQNEVYLGCIVWNRRGGKRNPVQHNENIQKSPFNEKALIVHPELWIDTLNLKEKKSNLTDPKYFLTPFILKNKLICAKCGQTLNCKNYGKNKKSVYRCPTSNENSISHLIIEKSVIENQVINELLNILKEQKFDSLWEIYIKNLNDVNEEDMKTYGTLEKMIMDKKDKKVKIENILPVIIDVQIKYSLQDLHIALTKEQELHEKQKSNLDIKFNNQFRNLDEFKSFLNKIHMHFNKLDNSKKRMFIDMIVEKIEIKEIDKENDPKKEKSKEYDLIKQNNSEKTDENKYEITIYVNSSRNLI